LQRGPDLALKGRAVHRKRHIKLDSFAFEVTPEQRRHPFCERVVILSRA
jgi:hypothetical protein